MPPHTMAPHAEHDCLLLRSLPKDRELTYASRRSSSTI